MEIQPLEKDKKTGRTSFLLKGITPQMANALRRAMTSEVPTMAIHEVEFVENSSVLYDEIIAHRLGLVPLTTDLKSYTLRSKCKCGGEGCARCTAKLTLKAKGPCTVYASDMKSSDPKIKPVYPDMIIVKLAKGQALEFEATAQLGKGKTHAKWSPCLAWYRHKPIIEIDEKKCTNPEACSQACPVGIYEYKNGKLSINKEKLLLCHLCQACAEIAENESIKVKNSEDEFIYFIESWGQLSPAEIAKAAANELSEMFSEFEEKLSAAKSSTD